MACWRWALLDGWLSEQIKLGVLGKKKKKKEKKIRRHIYSSINFKHYSTTIEYPPLSRPAMSWFDSEFDTVVVSSPDDCVKASLFLVSYFLLFFFPPQVSPRSLSPKAISRLLGLPCAVCGVRRGAGRKDVVFGGAGVAGSPSPRGAGAERRHLPGRL